MQMLGNTIISILFICQILSHLCTLDSDYVLLDLIALILGHVAALDESVPLIVFTILVYWPL